MVGVAGAPIGSVAEDDGGHSTGGKNKNAKCAGGYGKHANSEGLIYVGRLSANNLLTAQAFSRFEMGTLANVVDHSRIVFTGKVYGGGDWPKCRDRPGILPIARVFSGFDGRYMRIFVYGSHRGT